MIDETSRDLVFYDFPWKGEEIYEGLTQVGYVERLSVKRDYKNRTVRTKIRLTKDMEVDFMKGGSNITIMKEERLFFFRMFDAKLPSREIKKRYS